MKKKIVVIGAGMGGLQAAKVLSENGYSVTVYEMSQRENLCHDQIDVVETKLFTDLCIPVPEGSKKSTPCYFVGPDTDKSLLLNINEDERDWSIERRTFGRERVDICEKVGVKFNFGSKVQSLVFENDCVVGVKVKGKKIKADLVIDACGCNSPFRESFGGKFGITSKPAENEVFNVYHSYYQPAEGVIYDDKYKFYLKYAGVPGISWCGMEFDGSISTLIGSIGELSEDVYRNAFECLKKDNPIISDILLRGGHHATIPVRYPLPIMVSDGYAAVGDSAFMTIPLLGNGIANAIRAGQMLAEAVIADDSVSKETLWKYNYRYFREIGALCCLVDFIKRGLIESDNDDLKFLFESGIITDSDIDAIFSGKLPDVSPSDLINRIKNAYKIRRLFKNIAGKAFDGVKAFLTAYQIPSSYDPSKIFAWKFKLDNLYN